MSLRRIRTWLLAGLVLPAALLFTPAQAQFGRPPGGGIGGRPGGVGGGMPGPPVGIGGGGVAGGIGGGGIGGRPGGIGGGGIGGGGIGGGGIGGGGFGGGGLQQDEWVCGKCGRVLGRGPAKPIMTNCPYCGVAFRNGLDVEFAKPGGVGGPPGIGGPPIGGPPIGGPPGGGAEVPATPPPKDLNPPAEKRADPPPEKKADAPAANNNNNGTPAPADNVTAKVVVIVAAIGGGVLLLFAALGTFLYISATRSAQDDVPQRRRKRVYHDED
jgi:hypothetical protein